MFVQEMAKNKESKSHLTHSCILVFATKESGERVNSEVCSLHVMDRKLQHSSVHMVSSCSGANLTYYQQEKRWANRQECSYSNTIYGMGHRHSAVNIFFLALFKKKVTFTCWHTMMKVLTLILPWKMEEYQLEQLKQHKVITVSFYLSSYISIVLHINTYTNKKKNPVTNECKICCYTRKHILSH